MRSERFSSTKITKFQIPKKYLIFNTCGKCQHREAKHVSQQAYEKGSVALICSKCQSLTMIRDNLNFFGFGAEQQVAVKHESDVQHLSAADKAILDKLQQ